MKPLLLYTKKIKKTNTMKKHLFLLAGLCAALHIYGKKIQKLQSRMEIYRCQSAFQTKSVMISFAGTTLY
jgi:hypothetical protein